MIRVSAKLSYLVFIAYGLAFLKYIFHSEDTVLSYFVPL